MSLVVFPVAEEDPAVVAANLATAAGHQRVEEVWAVTAGPPEDALERAAAGISEDHDTPVRVLPQARMGDLRPGKGDAVNTALHASAERGFERTHFYDSDITNFDRSWIDGAERAADRGYPVVRHRFPRAATDAMITWMVTRPGLALLFPGTILPRHAQPLGGEILISGEVVERLAADRSIISRSDWGIDTMITYATATSGLPIYEHLVTGGKRHRLYGSLAELRTMVVECLEAVASLRGRPPPPADAVFDSAPPAPVPDDLKRTVAFDFDSSFSVLIAEWESPEADLARALPHGIGERLAGVARPSDLAFLDAETWKHALRFLLDGFTRDDGGWEALAFRLWLGRVLAYATGPALEGYDHAISYLEETIRRYQSPADQDVEP
ncbi:MAG: mannosylglycerate synthase domain-containing protein [Acidimicrobiia bacterium]